MAVRNKTKKKTEKEKEVKEGTNGESDAANQIALPTAHRSVGRSVVHYTLGVAHVKPSSKKGNESLIKWF